MPGDRTKTACGVFAYFQQENKGAQFYGKLGNFWRPAETKEDRKGRRKEADQNVTG